MTFGRVKPENLNDIWKIKGFGGQKIAKFDTDILALLNSIWRLRIINENPKWNNEPPTAPTQKAGFVFQRQIYG